MSGFFVEPQLLPIDADFERDWNWQRFAEREFWRGFCIGWAVAAVMIGLLGAAIVWMVMKAMR